MLISLEGNIIDTEDIYGISEIQSKEESFFNHSFTINFFNKKKMKVTHDIPIYISSNINCAFVEIKGIIQEDYKILTRDAAIEKIRNSEIYKQSLVEINNLKNQIVDYWNKYKLDIPMLELDKSFINLDY